MLTRTALLGFCLALLVAARPAPAPPEAPVTALCRLLSVDPAPASSAAIGQIRVRVGRPDLVPLQNLIDHADTVYLFVKYHQPGSPYDQNWVPVGQVRILPDALGPRRTFRLFITKLEPTYSTLWQPQLVPRAELMLTDHMLSGLSPDVPGGELP